MLPPGGHFFFVKQDVLFPRSARARVFFVFFLKTDFFFVCDIMNDNIIKRTFLDFAKFPKRSAVEHLFLKTPALGSSYEELLSLVQELPEDGLFPEIENFMFSSNENEVKNWLRDLTGIYLLVDFGIINSKKDQYSNEQNDVRLSAHIGMPWVTRDRDSIETLIAMNNLLNLTWELKLKIQENKCPLKKYISIPVNIMSIDTESYKRDLSRECIGWIIEFNRDALSRNPHGVGYETIKFNIP